MDEYCFDKMGLHRRAMPGISQSDLMLEMWKGLEKNAPECQVMSWRQRSTRDFQEELRYRVESMIKSKKNKKNSWERKNSWTVKNKGGGERDKTANLTVKKKPSEKGHGLCICGGDHYRRDCPNSKNHPKKKTAEKPPKKENKKKSYKSHATEDESTEEDNSESDSPSSDDSTVDGRRLTHYTVMKRAMLSFGHKTVSTNSAIDVVELPQASSVGNGLSWLNGDPMPVEVWFDIAISPRTSVTGCADSGGQCLIRSSILAREAPHAVVKTHGDLRPAFEGIGGATAKPLGYVTLPIYLPDAGSLKGQGGKVAKLWVEFQVVDQLNCNFLLGRDAMRAYKVDIVESEGVILIGGVRVPIADHHKVKSVRRGIRTVVTAFCEVVVQAGQSCTIPIMLSCSVPAGKELLFVPDNVVDVPRELRGVMPYTLMLSSTPFVLFDNACDYPIKIEKGQNLGTVSLLTSGAIMTHFAGPTVTLPPPTTSPRADHECNDEFQGYNPWVPAGPSRLDILWSKLVENRGLYNAFFSESWTSTKQSGKSTHVARPIADHPDPNTLPVSMSAFGETVNDDEQDRLVDVVKVALKEDERPAPEFKELAISIDKNLSSTMQDQLLSVIRKFAACFSFGGRRLGDVDMPPMSIDVTGTPSSCTQAYRESPRTAKNIKESVNVLRDMDIIEEGTGPIASPVVMIKQNNKWRFCVDFRAVNELTPLDRYPIPRPDAVFAALSGAQFFSTVDANKGYHQFRLAKESRWLTTFITEREGVWQYKRVPFGLQNAPAFFQRSMDSLLGCYRWQFALAYIDDVVIWSKTWDEHLVHVEKVLAAFKRVNLTLDERKCNWGFTAVDLLGLRVNRLGLRTLKAKTKAIEDLPFPKNVKQLRQILGQFSYYRQFMRGFAITAEPLTSALKFAEPKHVKSDGGVKEKRVALTQQQIKAASREAGRRLVTATPERVQALADLKRLLCNAPVLRYPDFTRPFFLYTDASGRGLGGALQQEFVRDEHPILFISRALSPAEKNYSATELECLAVYWSFCKLSHYIDGCDGLTVMTNHHALLWLWNVKQTTNSRLHRWATLLNPYRAKLKVVHRAGANHSNVDPLSRFPSMKTSPYMSSVQPVNWHDLGDEYMADENVREHWKKATRGVVSSTGASETAFERLGRSSPAQDVKQIPSGIREETSVTVSERLGRLSSDDTVGTSRKAIEIPDTSEAVREQLGRVYQENPTSDNAVESLWNFRICDKNLLWRTNGTTEHLCVPTVRRVLVLKIIHDELGHPGAARALSRAIQDFWWPFMRCDIDLYCRSCHFSQMVKTDTSKKPGKLNPIKIPPPLHTLCIDFVEALPPSKGFDSLAMITDKFTKSICLIPCRKSTTAEAFAVMFFRRVYPIWGVPEKIISDRDRRFVSTFWKTLMEKAGTKVALTTAYHPQGNGQSERTNRTVEAMLRILVMELPKNVSWVDLLPTVELAHNSTPNTTTGLSPYKMLYTAAPKTFGEMAIPRTSGASSMSGEDMSKRLAEWRLLAKSAMERAQLNQKQYFDAKHSPLIFLPGDLARLTHSGTFRRVNKLDPTSQLVRIVELVAPGAYRIKVPEGLRMHDVVSIEHLRRYNFRDETAVEPEPIPSEQRKANKVCGERLIGGNTEFLVQFDYDEDAEWIVKSDCKEWIVLIEEFRKREGKTEGIVEEKVEDKKAPEDGRESPLLIDGVEFNEPSVDVVSVRRSGRKRKKKVFFDDDA